MGPWHSRGYVPRAPRAERGLQRLLCLLLAAHVCSCMHRRARARASANRTVPRPAPLRGVSVAVSSASRSRAEDRRRAHFAEMQLQRTQRNVGSLAPSSSSPVPGARHLLPCCNELNQPFLLVGNVLRCCCSSVLFIAW